MTKKHLLLIVETPDEADLVNVILNGLRGAAYQLAELTPVGGALYRGRLSAGRQARDANNDPTTIILAGTEVDVYQEYPVFEAGGRKYENRAVISPPDAPLIHIWAIGLVTLE